jgi:hypothetical protein
LASIEKPEAALAMKADFDTSPARQEVAGLEGSRHQQLFDEPGSSPVKVPQPEGTTQHIERGPRLRRDAVLLKSVAVPIPTASCCSDRPNFTIQPSATLDGYNIKFAWVESGK